MVLSRFLASEDISPAGGSAVEISSVCICQKTVNLEISRLLEILINPIHPLCNFFRTAEKPSFTEGRKSANAIRLRYFIVLQNRAAQNPFIRVIPKFLSGILQTKYQKIGKNTKTNNWSYF